MTAVNVFLRPDRGFLMTDGAFYQQDGTIIGFGNKAYAIPNLKAVIAVRGLQAIVPNIGLQLSIGYKDFDDAVSQLGNDMKRWHRAAISDLMDVGMPTFEFHILGWSERHGKARHFTWTNHYKSEDEDFCELIETNESVANYSISPPIEDKQEIIKNLVADGVFMYAPNFLKTFDPKLHGVSIMDAQRRQEDTMADGDSGERMSVVGGFVCVSEVDSSGVHQKVIHRYSDKVGEKVKPAPFARRSEYERHAAFAKTSGMILTRQQRRALERQGKDWRNAA